jgi:hypothetical protein
MDPAGQPLAAAAELAATSDEMTDMAPAATDASLEPPLP